MTLQFKTLYAITHTETYYNYRRIFAGQYNSNLTPRGHRQAEILAQKLKNKKLDVVFISPLTRSRQTLNHILRYHPQVKIKIDKRLTERDYGKLSRKSKIKYRRGHPELYEKYHRSYNTPPPGGESMIKVEKRIRAFLKDAISLIKKQKSNALVIAHNNSIRPIRRYFEKLSPREMMHQDNHNQIFQYKIKI